MEIKTIAVLGAGAVGSYFLAGLAPKFGEDLWAVARGERRQRLMGEGLTINGSRLSLHVKTPEEARNADLLIVAVKYGALPDSLADIQAVAGPQTVVLCPMNGVDSEEIIAGAIGREQVVDSMIKIASQRLGGSIVFPAEKTPGLYFGEEDGALTPRIRAIAGALDGSGVRYHISGDIRHDIWFKFAMNISKNLPQAFLNVGFGAYADSRHVAFLSAALRREVVQVAAALGVDIESEADPDLQADAVSPEARFSTLQDLDAHRPTEIDMFSGAMIRMGRQLGIPTPYNEFTYHTIKALEEKNAGLIR